jgi:hypothetical protein
MAPITHSPFLDILPAELRLRIYTQLLVTPDPLKGRIARQDTKYNLHTAILRTNKQIYSEARPVFLGKNTFYITFVSPTSSSNLTEEEGEEGEEGSGAFEPPLQLADLPLVRHLQVDMLYYPKILRTITDPRIGAWRPLCVGAERYIISLSYLLGAVQSNLLSLALCADTRRYVEVRELTGEGENVDEDVDEDDYGEVNVKKMLIGFYVADGNSRFRKALRGLRVKTVGLHFDFPEAHFDFKVVSEVLHQQSLVDLMGQVLMVRSEILLKSAMWELGECEEVAEEGTVSLTPDGNASDAFQLQVIFPPKGISGHI